MEKYARFFGLLEDFVSGYGSGAPDPPMDQHFLHQRTVCCRKPLPGPKIPNAPIYRLTLVRPEKKYIPVREG